MKISDAGLNDIYNLKRALTLFDSVEFETDDWWAEIVSRENQLNAINEWLRAATVWKRQVREWLNAENKHTANVSDEFYIAGSAGWAALKVLTPNLDGVAAFDDLPLSMQYRYAAFARGVVDAALNPNVVLSMQQKHGRTALPTLPEYLKGDQ